MTDLGRIRAVRAGNRGVITKLTKEAEYLLKEDQTDKAKGRLQTIDAILKEKLKVVKELDEKVLNLCEVEDIPNEVEEADEIISRILDVQRYIEEDIVKAKSKKSADEHDNVNQTTTSQMSTNTNAEEGGKINTVGPVQTSQNQVIQTSENQGTSTTVFQQSPTAQQALNPSTIVQTQSLTPVLQSVYTGSHQTRPKLPKLVLPKFKGDITHYRTFWDSFESAVHTNPELSKIDKFNYLNSLLEGRALRAIQGLTISEDNYEAAIEIVRQRFGKPQQIIAAHMDELMKISACTADTPSQLRFVYDKVSVHVRGLASLGIDSKQYGSLLIPVIMAKLPQDVRIQIGRVTTKDIWEISDILDVILKEVEAREVGESVKVNGDNRKPPSSPRLPAAFSLLAQETQSRGKPFRCVYCDDYHFSASCKRVTDTNARREILKRDKRCFVCLGRNHRSDQCDQNKSCRRCHGNHHQSICPTFKRPFNPKLDPPNQGQHTSGNDRPKTNHEQNQESQTQVTPVVNTTTTSANDRRKVLLQTAVAYADGKNGSQPVKARILLDSGSQRSYITNSLKRRLGLVPVKTETLNLNTFGDERFTKQRCDLVQLSLRGKNGDRRISALCFPKICSPLSTTLDVTRHPHLQGLDLADISIVEGNTTNIDILIGSDYYFDVIKGEIVRGENGPVAIDSEFGWVVSGPTTETEADPGDSLVSVVIENSELRSNLELPGTIENDKELTRTLRRFWDVEAIGIREEPQTNETEFLRDIQFKEEDGRYEVRLPWKNDCAPKSNGYNMCVKRLHQLQSRLKKDKSLLSEYDNIVREQERNGIVESASRNETGGYFLPHHGVIRQDKDTTKLRMVFDGSAKLGDDSPSLNDCLEKGPNLVPHLFDTVIKFRGYPIAIVADIEKAFHQVQIATEDREMVKFLWFDDINKTDPEIKHYRFRRLPFGLTPSPAILASIIRYHLSIYEEANPTTVQLLRDSLYVDDFAGGAYEESEALQVYQTSKELMTKGGFTLRKWNSNSEYLRQRFADQENTPAENTMKKEPQEGDHSATTKESEQATTSNEGNKISPKVKQAKPTSEENCYVKFLGINWNVHTDEFRYDFTKLIAYAKSLPTTKRSVLKISAKVFDPMGLISPFTINMKALFQVLCQKDVDWDDQLEGEALARWNSMVNDLHALHDVKVPRCYFNSTDESPINHQLHGFCDASEKAFAAAVYLRTEHNNGRVDINLVASKTRVAPISKQSIPRLELLGANILARLIDTIRKAVTSLRSTPEITLWTDSYTTLCWIRNEKPWKQYVLNRVQEIRELTAKTQWRHCPGELNPADLPSRGCSGRELVCNEIWWKGPKFLASPQEEWPKDPQPVSNFPEQANVELVKRPPLITHSLTGISTNDKCLVDLESIIDCKRYSTSSKLLRVTAMVLRFVSNLKSKQTPRKTSDLVAEELIEAENLWIKSIQAKAFPEDIQQLRIGRTTTMTNQLGLFIDENKIIRCEGRINNSTVPEATKQPILLPSRHYFTELVIRERHERVHHNGIRETLNCVREKYWVPRGREAVKRIIRPCVTCKRFEGKMLSSRKEPHLPQCRVSEDPPFTYTGIDFAGPIYVNNDSKQKTYICLYTCASTRAVHLELTENLSVTAFLQSFRRFTSRRGVPSRLLSDNAKTFKSAAKEVRTIVRSTEVQRYLATNGVTWQFIIEKAPWQGGFWERLIQSTKRCLKKILGQTSITFEALRTILVEIEATLNSRPLTYIYDDDEGVSYPLTPSQLIYGRQIPTTPNGRQFEIVSTHQALTKKAKHQKRLLAQFVKRWKREYLLSIRETSRALHGPEGDGITVGDIVILKEEGTPRAFWKLARIQQLIRSDDGVTRAAKIRVVQSGKGRVTELRRPVQYLIPLELHMGPEEVPEITIPKNDSPSPNPTTTTGRPRRAAAIIGELSRRKK